MSSVHQTSPKQCFSVCVCVFSVELVATLAVLRPKKKPQRGCLPSELAALPLSTLRAAGGVGGW